MEKDFRSLEHKIRDVMVEAMARNSAKRMQVTNVARPDTATDPTDVKSKIAKQGEIKTKIIDEGFDDHEQIARELIKRHGKNVTHKHISNLAQERDSRRALDYDEIMRHVKKLVNEEVEQVDEISRALATRYIAATKGDDNGKRKAGNALALKKKWGDKKYGLPEPRVKATEEVERISEASRMAIVKAAAKSSAAKAGVTTTPTKKDFASLPKKRQDAINNMLRRGHTTSDAYHKTRHLGEEDEQVDEAYGKSEGKTATGTKWSDGKFSVSVQHGDNKHTFTGSHSHVSKKLKQEHGMNMMDVKFKKASDMKEDIEQVDEARKGYAKGYKSPWDKIEKAKPGIGKRIDAHVDALKQIADKDKKKDVKEGAVPDNWEENSVSKRKATAKSLTKSTTHDKSAKIVEGEMDDQDAKKIKGGVTQVELNPKTDDRTEDQSSEDKVGKKAASKANKEIGQKTKPVKEETMSKLTFGLPENLIQTVAETLKGGQKKIDKNHNGKIDSEDFKILRGETKAKAKPQYDKMRPAFKEEAELKEAKNTNPAYTTAKAAVAMHAKGKDYRVKAFGHDPHSAYIHHKDDPEGNEIIHVKHHPETGMISHSHEYGQAGLQKGEPSHPDKAKHAISKIIGEEVKLTAKELARIEEIAKNLE